MQEVNKVLVRRLRGKAAAAKSDGPSLTPDYVVVWTDSCNLSLTSIHVPRHLYPPHNKQMLEK